MKKFKNIALVVMTLTLIGPVTFISGCTERSTERVEVQKDNPDTVVVPDKNVDVNVHNDNTAPAPDVVHKDTSTNTTVERNSDTGKTKTETNTSTTVH